MEFSRTEYYARQIVLPELRQEGQEKLWKSVVTVVGLGGLGSVSALYLALAGVGKLRLIDQDTIELHNLHRQALYTFQDLRLPKVEVAAQRLHQVNPEITLEAIPENLRESNVNEIIHGSDCVVDGLDNMVTRYTLNSACYESRIPYLYGGAIGLEGNVSLFHPPGTPCLECLFPGVDDHSLPTCETRGVVGATTGTIGAIQALEAVKFLAGLDGTLAGRLLVCDLRYMEILTIPVSRRRDCPVCGKVPRKVEAREGKLAWLCGHDTVNVNPPKPLRLDLEAVQTALGARYRVLARTPMVIVFQLPDQVEVSLFRQGRMLIKNVSSEEKALQVYSSVIEQLPA